MPYTESQIENLKRLDKQFNDTKAQFSEVNLLHKKKLIDELNESIINLGEEKGDSRVTEVLRWIKEVRFNLSAVNTTLNRLETFITTSTTIEITVLEKIVEGFNKLTILNIENYLDETFTDLLTRFAMTLETRLRSTALALREGKLKCHTLVNLNETLETLQDKLKHFGHSGLTPSILEGLVQAIKEKTVLKNSDTFSFSSFFSNFFNDKKDSDNQVKPLFNMDIDM